MSTRTEEWQELLALVRLPNDGTSALRYVDGILGVYGPDPWPVDEETGEPIVYDNQKKARFCLENIQAYIQNSTKWTEATEAGEQAAKDQADAVDEELPEGEIPE